LVALLSGPAALSLFTTWLVGAAIAWKGAQIATLVGQIPTFPLNALRVGALLATVGAMALDKIQGGAPDRVTTGTLLCAVGAAVLVALFITDVQPKSRAVRASLRFTNTQLAESSYSLYAYHLPVLLMISTILTPEGATSRFSAGAIGWLLVGGVTLALIMGGWLFARATEFHYHSLRARALHAIRARSS